MALVVMTLPFGTSLAADMVFQGLRYVAHSLNVSFDTVTRLPDCYVGGFVLGLFLSGLFADWCGWNRLYLGSMLAWSVASLGCGMATNFAVLAITAVLLALAAGGMVGSGAIFLLHISSRWSRPVALTWLAALAVLQAGGWIPFAGQWLRFAEWFCANYPWRWGFYMGVPFGLIAAGLCALVFGWERAGGGQKGTA